MKLAEALVLRADCQKRISRLKQRLERCAKVQEGEEAPEDPEVLLGELKHVIRELTVFVKKINQTNHLTSFDGSMTLAEALAERDALAMERDILDALIEQATVKYDRFTRSEVKYISRVNIAELHKKKDDLAKRYRELDFKIQEKNWTAELIEK